MLRSTGASEHTHLSVLCAFLLYLTCLPAYLFSSLLALLHRGKTGSPLGVIKVSRYHSDISQNDVGLLQFLTCSVESEHQDVMKKVEDSLLPRAAILEVLSL